MKLSGILIACVLFFSLLFSCAIGPEGKGDRAYKQAQGVVGELKLRKEKEAYLFYLEAVRNNPKKASIRLRNRFIEMTLNRAQRFMIDGSAQMDAIPRFMSDIDTALSPEVAPALKDEYAAFIAQLADSNYARKKLYKTINLLDKAISVAATKATYEQRKKSIMDNFAKENYEASEIELVNGLTNKDNQALIRAEFYLKVTQLYNPKYPGLDSLFKILNKENKATYSAYPGVVLDKPDSSVWNAINKYDIYLAIPKMTETGGSAYMEASMYNYSCNPQRMKPSNFYIVDQNGAKSVALPNSTFEREILDQEHESKMKLYFKKAGGAPIKKLCFQSDTADLVTKHYAEKLLF